MEIFPSVVEMWTNRGASMMSVARRRKESGDGRLIRWRRYPHDARKEGGEAK